MTNKELTNEELARIYVQWRECENDIRHVMAEQLDKMRDDIAQVTNIVAEASRGLGEGFKRISANITGRSALVQCRPDELAAVSRDIDRDCSLAVTLLQFEDMVKQTLAEMDRRVLVMQSMLAALEEQGDAPGTGCLPEIYKTGFEKAGKLLSRMRESLTAFEHKTVEQKNMSVGDIELFR